MDVKQAIEQRRSIRKYKVDEVSDNLIKEILEAGRLVPTGNNAQPQRFYIVKKQEDKQKLKDNNIFFQDFVYTAPVIIVCAADPQVYTKQVKGWDSDNNTRALRDLSLATSFMLLRATELKLGTCVVGWIDKEKIKKILNIPSSYIVPYIVTLGYADEKPKERVRKDLNDFILN
jgi:nitroreductase